MKKIKTLFVINRENDLATEQAAVGSDWVFNGEGIATIKHDGSSCMIKDGILYKRWNRKLSKLALKDKRYADIHNKPFYPNLSDFTPLLKGAIKCNENFDPVTFHWPHWAIVDNDKANQFHNAALANLEELKDGTYEIVGPKIRCNPYKLEDYFLIKHDSIIIDIEDRSYEGIKKILNNLNEEGIVFHHKNGSLFKIRRKDFDLDWNEIADPRTK